MPTSYSIGNHLNLISLGARAARSYAAELPKEAMEAATRLEGLFDDLNALNARQEKAKQQLAMLTRELKAKKQESLRERARLIRLAEATFGPRDPRIKEFRPATEGKVRTARGEGIRRKAERASSEPSKPPPVGRPEVEPARRTASAALSQPPAPLRSPSRERGDGGLEPESVSAFGPGAGQSVRRVEERPSEHLAREPSVSPRLARTPARAHQVPRGKPEGVNREGYGALVHLAPFRTEVLACPPPLPWWLLRDSVWRVGVVL
jgi:hypothetical protein